MDGGEIEIKTIIYSKSYRKVIKGLRTDNEDHLDDKNRNYLQGTVQKKVSRSKIKIRFAFIATFLLNDIDKLIRFKIKIFICNFFGHYAPVFVPLNFIVFLLKIRRKISSQSADLL